MPFSSQDIRGFAYKLALTVIASLLSAFLYFLPDLLTSLFYGTIEAFAFEDYYWIILLAGLFTTIMTNGIHKVVFVGFIGALQLLWIGSVIYFGEVITPDKIILSGSQGFEVLESLSQEFFIHVQALGIIALCLGLQWILQAKLFSKQVVRHSLLGILLPGLLIFGFIRAAVFPSAYILYPSQVMTSLVGSINTLVLAVRFTHHQKTVGTDNTSYDFSLTLNEVKEPTTVVVIMGESVSSFRMPLYGAPLQDIEVTKSRLLERFEKNGSDFKLIPKLGFAPGVATIASVPMFIKMAYHPVDILNFDKNLFDLAQEAGFKQWYFSAQRIKSLQIGGGAGDAEEIHAQEMFYEEYLKRRDEIILDRAKQANLEGDKRFIFVHQRSNHSGYADNCSEDAFEEISNLRQILEEYSDQRGAYMDIGMACYDRYVDDLIEFFASKDHATHIFITSDHNELSGEDGRWGHASLDVLNSLVPMILYTNRPNSEIAKSFETYDLISGFDFSRLVAKAMGYDVQVENFDPNVFFVNGVMPYGSAGHIKARRTGELTFDLETYLPLAEKAKVTKEVLNIPPVMMSVIKPK